MTETTKKSLLAAVIALIFLMPAFPVHAQEQEQRDVPKLEERIFSIKYRNVREIHTAIHYFVSNLGEISSDRGSSIIIVKDTPESLARIEHMIKLLDIPPANIRLSFFLFLGSKNDDGADTSRLPEGVAKGLSELGQVMAYRSFKLLDSGLLTFSSTADGGDLRLAGAQDLEFAIHFKTSYNQRSQYLRLENLSIVLLPGEKKGPQQLMRTDVGIEDGGVAVVGASTLNGGDEAFIAIVTMDVLK